MADNTNIEWADATVNAVNGCSLESPGCTNCYAMKLAGTRLRNHPSRAGLTMPSKAGPVWTGEVRLNEDQLLQPLKWKRPRRIFWNAHGDLFHPNVPDEWIDRVFAVCALTPQHTHMILTKRSARMREYLTARSEVRPDCPITQAAFWMNKPRGYRGNGGLCPQPLPNVWLGVSVEDQTRADQRIPDLLATPAAVRFISAEPLLGPVDLRDFCNGHFFQNALTGHRWHDAPEGVASSSDMAGTKLDWVIVGGESGPNARPMYPDWARALRDQCAAADVPFFFKQWGEWGPDTGPQDLGPPARDKIMEGAGACAVRVGDVWQQYPDGYAVPLDLCMAPGEFLYRLGKKTNGHLLDGVEHFAFPDTLG